MNQSFDGSSPSKSKITSEPLPRLIAVIAVIPLIVAVSVPLITDAFSSAFDVK